MTRQPYYLTEQSIASTLKLLFTDPDSDQITVQEIFRKAGRADRAEEQNRSWLSNRLSGLSQGKLVKKQYEKKTGRIERVRLTPEGMLRLGRVAGSLPKPY